MKQLILAARLIFGAWMLVNGANYLFLSLWSAPSGHEPLATQLMDALVHSKLLGVAMTVQLVTGALILSGFFVPVALCVVMPISTCALYWSLILDHQALGTCLALIAFALNGGLMLAYIDHYTAVLRRQAAPYPEEAGGRMSFDVLFANPAGRTSRGEFLAALITLLAVAAFYKFLPAGRTAQWCLLALLFPAIVLHARRLHDMGRSAWLLILPGGLLLAAFAIWVHAIQLGAALATGLTWLALAVAAAFALWGCIGTGQSAANRFGAAAATPG